MAPIRVTGTMLHVNIVPAGNRKSYGLTLIVVMMSSPESDRRWWFIIIRMWMCEHIQGKHNDWVTLNVPAGHSVALVGRSGPMMFLHYLHTNYRRLERNNNRMLTSNWNPLSSSGIGSQDLFTLSSSLIGSFLLKNQKPVWRTIGRLMVWALVLDGEVKKSWYSVWLESGLDLLFSSDLDQINQFD